MPPIPSYLVVITLVLVVLPSIAAILFRWALHQHLVYLEKRVRRLINQEERGQQPKIVEDLEVRFKDASFNLEQVNTAALIDQVYSREKVGFISCEQIDYFCRLLPNLLLSFGLLGTFLGITINLTALSQTISQTTANDVSSLVGELQKPLQGMGIAFTASLTGIFFSALLTVVNLLKNTSIAKYRLVSSLEDYLDNIYLPTLNNQTRLDKVVKGMADSFESFLTRFGQTVREAVESSLKDKIQEIVDANIQATDLAKEVYKRFIEASGTIARSADEFKLAADRYTEAAAAFERSEFAKTLADATTNFARSTDTLAKEVGVIEAGLKELHDSSERLVNVGEEVSRNNQTSARVLELHSSNQQSLGEIIPQLYEGAQSFQKAVVMLENLQQQIVSKTDNLDEVQEQLGKLVASVKSYTEGVKAEIESLGDRLLVKHDQNLQTIADRIEQAANQIVTTLKERVTPPEKNQFRPNAEAIDTTGQLTSRILIEEYRKEYEKAEQAYVNGNYSDAAVIVDKLFSNAPKHTKISLLRGNIYSAMQNYDIAKQAYQLVLQLSKDPQIRKSAQQGLDKIGN